MDEVEKDNPPSILQQKVDKRKDSFDKNVRLLGSIGISFLSGGKSENEIAWPIVVKAVRERFKNEAITALPPADQWIKQYNLPKRTPDRLIRLRPYYTALANKIKENIEKKKQEFVSLITK